MEAAGPLGIGWSRRRWRPIVPALIAFVLVGCSLALAGVADAQVSPNNVYLAPAGAYVGKRPVGWVIVIHGGGWSYVGAAAVAAGEPYFNYLRRHGWGTYNIDYRAGADSLTDVVSAYDALRHRIGTKTPICVAGGSAGAQLSLLLAADRPAVRCVIAEGAPTDFLTLTSEPAWAPPGYSAELGPDRLMKLDVIPAFGASEADLWRWSPVRVASRIRAHVLLGASTLDFYVPAKQMSDMQRARPRDTRIMLLPGATLPQLNFTHASVTAHALERWQHAELVLLAQAARGSWHGRSRP